MAMERYRLCVVDDDAAIRETLTRYFSAVGYEVEAFAEPVAALKRIEASPPHLVLLDLVLPEMSGIEVLRRIKAGADETVVIMISGYGTIQSAVEALKLGAADFLTKPLNLEEVQAMLDKSLERVRLKEEVERLRFQEEDRFLSSHLFSRNKGMAETYENARRAAALDRLTVLITGETGTGKEVMARYIHYHSPRRDRPLVVVNCSAIPRELIESELFGYAKGAFTGAAAGGKKGKFEVAHTGTLFLDEIGDLELSAQAKILRFLEERELERVGAPRSTKVDVRLIAATNKNLGGLIDQSLFRADLYYRLAVMHLPLPPLRDRPEDILPLARHFAASCAQECGRRVSGLTAATEAMLLGYHWPGNIRELKNLMERAVLFNRGRDLDQTRVSLAPAPLFSSLPSPQESGEVISLAEMQRWYVQEVLDQAQGNKSEAARRLGISRARLRRLLEAGNS